MAFDADLTLLYQFAADKALTSVAGLGPTLGITRTTDATYFDSSGVMQTASTGVARFDHLPISPFTSLGLFVEEARTNICLRSKDWGTTWARSQLTHSADTEVAPDGNTTADTVSDTAVDSFHYTWQTISTTAAQHVFSVYLKAGTLNWVKVNVNGGGLNNSGAFFNLSDGTIGTVNAVDDKGIEDVGGGWYRCWIKHTYSSATSTTVQLWMGNADNNASFLGDGTGTMHFWGAQLELGDSPSSFIETIASSVTRNADEVTTTTLSWLDAAATAVGTWYVRGQFPYVATAARALLTLDDGGTTDRFYFERDAAENINFSTTHSADTDGLVSGVAVIAAATAFELGASYIDDDVVMAVDSTLETADTTAAIPLADNPTTLRVGADSGGNYWNGHIAELRYYDVQKNDTFVVQLSNGEIEESPSGGVRLTKFTFRMGFRM